MKIIHSIIVLLLFFTIQGLSQIDGSLRLSFPVDRDDLKKSGIGPQAYFYIRCFQRIDVGYNTEYTIFVPGNDYLMSTTMWLNGIQLSVTIIKKPEISLNGFYGQGLNFQKSKPIDLGNGATFDSETSKFGNKYWGVGVNVFFSEHFFALARFQDPIIYGGSYVKFYNSSLLSIGIGYRPWNMKPLFPLKKGDHDSSGERN